ncbi:MAG: hypothetical protein M0022_07725 [Desulfobacteraceae bacterium]|nr:hypothetical protein [Desulfobacteraceae bacterium]
MNKMKAIKTKLKERSNKIINIDDISSVDFEEEVGNIGLGSAGIVAGLVGAWSLICLAAGLIAAHGPIGFITSWIGAVIGN